MNTESTTEFKSLNLLPSILTQVEAKGYINPTPIQVQAIPPLLEGKDLLGLAKTGSGKTAAFSLPLIDRLGRNKRGLHLIILGLLFFHLLEN